MSWLLSWAALRLAAFVGVVAIGVAGIAAAHEVQKTTKFNTRVIQTGVCAGLEDEECLNAIARFVEPGKIGLRGRPPTAEEIARALRIYCERYGCTGPRGAQGIPGRNGSVGPQGARGAPGAPGPQGERGEPGPKGDKGDKGDAGSDGSSAPPGNVPPRVTVTVTTTVRVTTVSTPTRTNPPGPPCPNPPCPKPKKP